jgi:hypothetical protein
MAGQIPSDARRVVFEDDNYNPPKDEKYDANVLTWHWDNIQVFTDDGTGPAPTTVATTAAPTTVETCRRPRPRQSRRLQADTGADDVATVPSTTGATTVADGRADDSRPDRADCSAHDCSADDGCDDDGCW